MRDVSVQVKYLIICRVLGVEEKRVDRVVQSEIGCQYLVRKELR